MLTKLAPQSAEDSSGYIVQVANRFSIEYLEGDLKANVEAEFGPVTTIYSDTLKAVGHKNKAIVEDRKQELLKRIVEAMRFLGGKYELYDGR